MAFDILFNGINMNRLTDMDHIVCRDSSTYVGNIVTGANYDPPESIRMTTDIHDFPFRVIMKKNVETINGETIGYVAPKEEIRYVQGSGGVKYTVKTVGGTTTCTCPGFAFRKHCKHI